LLVSIQFITLSYHPKRNKPMTTSMARSNLKIIIDLRKFLCNISCDVNQRIKYTSSQNAFSRNRVLCFSTLALFLISIIKRSLNVELMLFFENYSIQSLCTKQALSKQRRKLKSIFFHHWNQELIRSFYFHNKDSYARWKGFRLLAVDGSSVVLPRTHEIKQTYGYGVNKTTTEVPMARICIMYDVLNELAIKGLLHPYHTAERDAFFCVCQDEELKDSLLLFDRGYLSYLLLYRLFEKQTHFVIRAQSNANKAVIDFLASNQTDIICSIYPSYKSLKKMKSMGITISMETPMIVRLVKIKLKTGETEVLVTNLYENKLYPGRVLKEVYNLRWGIETYYGYIKEELQLAQFSGISPICIEQDFAANLFVFNLQSIIEKQCEPTLKAINRKRKYPQKVNKNISWASLKCRIVRLFFDKKPNYILAELEKLFCRYTVDRRKGREYQRLKKPTTSAKHYTLTNYKRAI